MEYLIIFALVAYIFFLKSGKSTFFYMGPDEDKYDDAWIAVLTR